MNDNAQTNTNNSTPQPQTPSSIPEGQPSPQLDNQTHTPPSSNRKKILLISLVILIVIVVAGLFFYKNRSSSSPALSAKQSTNQTLAAALPQFSTSKSVAGYLKYDSSKFKSVDNLSKDSFSLSSAQTSSPKVNTFIFSGDLFNIDQSGLYLYDIAKNQTYKIADGGGNPKIMSDHFLLYGMQDANGQKATNSAVLLNMLTGEKKTVVKGDATDLSNNFCCSVSPDGLRLAIPRTGKIDIWDIRDGSTVSIPAQINPFHTITGATSVPYYDEIDYPTMSWLNNQTLIFADKPPTAISVEAGSVNNDPITNNLYALDLATKTATKLSGPSDGTFEISTANDGQTIFATTGSAIYQVGPQAKNQLVSNSGFDSISPDGTSIVQTPSLYSQGPGSVYSVPKSSSQIMNSLPDGLDASKVSQVLPQGWIDNDNLLLKIIRNTGGSNDQPEVIAVYNLAANKVTQYTELK